jgi:hypothetical protein
MAGGGLLGVTDEDLEAASLYSSQDARHLAKAGAGGAGGAGELSEIKSNAKRLVVQGLETEVLRMAERIAVFLDDRPLSKTTASMRLVGLPSMVSELISRKDSAKKQVEETRKLVEKAHLNALQTIRRCAEYLFTSAEEHCIQFIPHHLEMSAQWQAMRLAAMLLKSHVLRYQFLTETYTVETVEALRMIRYGMDLITHLTGKGFSSHVLCLCVF